jgi:hypothetical protein
VAYNLVALLVLCGVVWCVRGRRQQQQQSSSSFSAAKAAIGL